MAHNRSQIRDAVVGLLTASVSSATIYSERRNRIDSTMRPLVIVSLGTDDPDASRRAMGQPVYQVEHAQVLTVEIHTEAADGQVAAEAVDQIQLEIEGALASDLSLGGLVEIIEPAGSELEMLTDQDRVIAVRSCNYVLPWRAEFGAPDTPEN